MSPCSKKKKDSDCTWDLGISTTSITSPDDIISQLKNLPPIFWGVWTDQLQKMSWLAEIICKKSVKVKATKTFILWNEWYISIFSANHGITEPVAEIVHCIRRSFHPGLLKQGQLQQVAQGHDHIGFSISKEGDSNTSLGNLSQCLITLTVEMFGLTFLPLCLNKISSLLKFPVFPFMSAVLKLSTTDRNLLLSYFHTLSLRGY